MSLALDYAMLGYGTTIRYGQRRSAELNPLPAGELHPPFEHWHGLALRCQTADGLRIVLTLARLELGSWKRRPDPPPDGETLDQMQARIIHEGEGWTTKQVAMAFRCTPTLVRKTRIEYERNPETGRVEGSLEHARDLLGRGLTLRQAAMMTGIPKSTLHRLVANGSDGR